MHSQRWSAPCTTIRMRRGSLSPAGRNPFSFCLPLRRLLTAQCRLPAASLTVVRPVLDVRVPPWAQWGRKASEAKEQRKQKKKMFGWLARSHRGARLCNSVSWALLGSAGFGPGMLSARPYVCANGNTISVREWLAGPAQKKNSNQRSKPANATPRALSPAKTW